MLLDHGARVGGQYGLKDDGERGERTAKGSGHDEHKQGDGGALRAGLGEAEGQFGRHRGLDPVVNGNAHSDGIRGSRGGCDQR